MNQIYSLKQIIQAAEDMLMKHYESNTGKFYFTPKGLDKFIFGYMGLIKQLKNVVDGDTSEFFPGYVIITSVIDPDKISFRDGLDKNVVELLVKMREEDANPRKLYASKKKILYTLENPFTTQLKEMNKDVR